MNWGKPQDISVRIANLLTVHTRAHTNTHKHTHRHIRLLKLLFVKPRIQWSRVLNVKLIVTHLVKYFWSVLCCRKFHCRDREQLFLELNTGSVEFTLPYGLFLVDLDLLQYEFSSISRSLMVCFFKSPPNYVQRFLELSTGFLFPCCLWNCLGQPSS